MANGSSQQAHVEVKEPQVPSWYPFVFGRKQGTRLLTCYEWMVPVGLLLTYLIVTVLSYHHLEPTWSYYDSIYFATVTMSTVGYGDLAPSSSASMVVTLMFIFVGIIVVFSQVAAFMNRIGIGPLFRKSRELAEWMFPMQTVDLDGDGHSDFEVPRHPLIFYSKNLILPIVVLQLIQMGFAALFVLVEPGWTYGIAVYHCYITATTVGYGFDMVDEHGSFSITTDGGKMLASAHILISVGLLATLISDIDDLRSKRQKMLERRDVLVKRLNPDLFKDLSTIDEKLRRPHRDTITKGEFVIGMLLKLGHFDEQDMEPFLKQFEVLDTDGSGTLTMDEIESGCLEMYVQKQSEYETILSRMGVGAPLNDAYGRRRGISISTRSGLSIDELSELSRV